MERGGIRQQQWQRFGVFIIKQGEETTIKPDLKSPVSFKSERTCIVLGKALETALLLCEIWIIVQRRELKVREVTTTMSGFQTQLPYSKCHVCYGELNDIYCIFYRGISACSAQEKTRALGSQDFTWRSFSAQIKVPYGGILLPEWTKTNTDTNYICSCLTTWCI